MGMGLGSFIAPIIAAVVTNPASVLGATPLVVVLSSERRSDIAFQENFSFLLV